MKLQSTILCQFFSFLHIIKSFSLLIELGIVVLMIRSSRNSRAVIKRSPSSPTKTTAGISDCKPQGKTGIIHYKVTKPLQESEAKASLDRSHTGIYGNILIQCRTVVQFSIVTVARSVENALKHSSKHSA